MKNFAKDYTLNIASLAEKLKLALQNTLPGRDAHKQMIPKFFGESPEYFNSIKTLRDAAVLIIFFEDEGKIKTIFIERMPDPGPHSGQIAFPGGRREDSDADLIETALREAEEEIGVKIDRENVLGSLTPIQIPISGYSVMPVICTTGVFPVFTMCEAEVKDIFVVDLLELIDSLTIKEIKVRGIVLEAPCFVFEKRIIWGATAMVLRELKEIILQFEDEN